jgi:hypothetical protein
LLLLLTSCLLPREKALIWSDLASSTCPCPCPRVLVFIRLLLYLQPTRHGLGGGVRLHVGP